MHLSKTSVFIALVVVALVVQKLVLPNLPKSAPPPAAAATPKPSKPLSPEVVRSRIVENLTKLSYAYSEYLEQHPGRSVTREDLLRERATDIKEWKSVVGESYPDVLEPMMEISARAPDGTVFYERTRVCFNCPPPPPEPPSDDALSWTPEQLLAATPDSLLAAYIYASNNRQSHQLKVRLHEQLGSAVHAFAPSAEFYSRAQAFLAARSTSQADRDLLFGRFCRPEIRFLRLVLQLAESAPTPTLQQAAVEALQSRPRAHLEQRLFPLAWVRSNDADVLRVLAAAIAQHCLYDDIDLLLNAALSTDPLEKLHRDIALAALQTITKPAAAELVAKRLQHYPPPDTRGEMLVRVLSRIESRIATEAALAWIQQCGHDCSELINSLEPHPRYYQVKATWARAHDSAEAFKNEQNREAILRHLAPNRPAHPIPNGSFESGTLDGFTSEGAVKVEAHWGSIIPTEGQHMIRLNTARDPIDGLSSVTSDPFVVPAGMQTLLFEFNFVGSVLLNPVNEMVEAFLLTGTGQVPIPDVRDLTMLGSYRSISGYELGTGFRTVQVSVAAWAGSAEKLRLKVILHGRGKLPDRIPGTSRLDHNPMGSDANPGTALFLDNIRLSSRPVVPLPPIGDSAFQGWRSGKAVCVKPVAAAFPNHATITIVDLAEQSHTLERAADGTYPVLVDEIENPDRWYHAGYSTPADDHGALYSQQVHLFMDELDSKLVTRHRKMRAAGDR